ncbi:NAD-dependent epimerase/dehydratase family protein [Rhodococcus sp. WS4]|nr:NAD-dependent epimerase/dehydratase family protein [Rhodococcus sp. WS4]
MARIAVFGSTGTIGSRIVAEALSRGHEVTAVVRDPAKVSTAHENLTVSEGDVLNAASVVAATEGRDVLVSAVGGGDGPGAIATIKPSAETLVDGLRSVGADAPRLVAVGGAGSLRTPDGKLVWDAEGLPEFLLQIMHAHGDALDYYRTVSDVQWTNITPPADIEPGDRTGTYRTAADDLLLDDAGQSRISTEDFAVAVVDEIERPQNTGRRFTVAY